MIKFIGTSHISPASINEVETTVLSYSPDIICLELDYGRFLVLTNQVKRKKYSFQNTTSFLLSLIGAYIEKKLARVVGTSPGDEMKKAIDLAKKNNIKLQLIDQDINITLKRLTSISKKEKFRILKDIIKGFFISLVPKKFLTKKFIKKNSIAFNPADVPEEKIIHVILNQVKKSYPEIYNALIEERNKVMANNIKQLINNNPDKKILVIIGAGHVSGIKALLKGD
ncbi:TraB/GumN family protein [Candidatus Woesearchaeota archaeon]|nr:TraB/GumN family protein [Candidatus Woesearchaeota archaeon]